LSGKSIERLTIKPHDQSSSPAPLTFSAPLTAAARIVAFSPSVDQAYQSIVIDAVASPGKRVTLLKLRAAQPQWYRRYWLQEPIELAAGTNIEVTATPSPPDDLAIPVTKRYPLQVGVDYVPM
jgi:hypothetical protein